MGKLQHSEHQSQEHAVLSTALMVGSALRKDTAVLLPTAYKHFLSLVKSPSVNEERSCRWLLKELEKILGHHMTSIRKQKKHGTVLSRTGGDLMHALSSALGVTARSASKSESTSATIEEKSACTCTIEEKISEVGKFLNHKLHNLASTLITNDKTEPFDYQTLDIDKQMELADPVLLQHNYTNAN